MKKRLEIITFVTQVIILLLEISLIVMFILVNEDYTYNTPQGEEGFYLILMIVIFPLLFCYRIFLAVSFCLFFCCCCICACIAFGKNVRELIWIFIAGSLDLMNICLCISYQTRTKIQSILDVLLLIIDCVYLLSSIVFGIFLVSRRKPGGNVSLFIIYLGFSIPLLVNLAVDFLRYIDTREASKDDSEIFKKVDKSKKCTKVFYRSTINCRSCRDENNCKNTEPEHRVKCHTTKDIFTLPNFDARGYQNIVVGFHQTSIRNAAKIIEDDFIPSSSGMLGPGIYFATNFDATDNKANNFGAIFVAQINLGRVEELDKQSRSGPIKAGYQSKYYHHRDGPEKDEFIVRDSSQIIKYVMVADKNKINEYHKSMMI